MGKADSQHGGALGENVVQLRPKGKVLPKVTLQVNPSTGTSVQASCLLPWNIPQVRYKIDIMWPQVHGKGQLWDLNPGLQFLE